MLNDRERLICEAKLRHVLSNGISHSFYRALFRQLLDFNITLTDTMPFGDHPAMVIYDTSDIYINPRSFLFRSFNIQQLKSLSDKEKELKRDEFNNMDTNYDLFDKYLPFVLIHEILHPLLLHKNRRGDRHPIIWNAACDYAIHNLMDMIDKESNNNTNTIKKDFEFYIRDLQNEKGICFHEAFYLMDEEEIYDNLIKSASFESESYTISLDDARQVLNGTKSLDDCEKQNNVSESVKGKDVDKKMNKTNTECPAGQVRVTQYKFEANMSPDKKNSENTIKNEGTVIEIGEDADMDPDKKEDQNKKSKEKSVSTRYQLASDLLKGNASVDIKKYLDRLFQVKIDWPTILKNSIQSCLEPSVYMHWSQPTDEFLSNPFTLPYMPNRDVEEKYGTCVLLLDQSGSMPDEDCSKAFDVVLQAASKYKDLLVVKHDYDQITTHFFEDTLKNEISEKDKKQLLVRNHCGGTSHKWALEYVDTWMKQNPESMVSIIIGLTDLCSDLETTQTIVNQKIPRIWLCNSDQQVPGLIGRVIRMH